jgi:uncharacterized membrane protein (UPF0127 family)
LVSVEQGDMRRVTVHNTTRGTTLADRAEWRGSLWGRGRGLLGRGGLKPGEGIVINPCNSVHMFFMRFAIDVVYLDRRDRVVKTVHNLRPFAVSMGGRSAHHAVELPAGTLSQTQTRPGDQLTVADALGVESAA